MRNKRLLIVVGLVYLCLVVVLSIDFLYEPRAQLHILAIMTFPSSLLPMMIMSSSWPIFTQWVAVAVCGLVQWVWISWRISKFFEK